ncbi:MAG: type II toxin-antitoxin system PemK/MazF family toxin [Bacteroidota bacterium]|nr:type II toxin-antitoxin system PemK/MazF family toxin [Bacteroidota bacterium]
MIKQYEIWLADLNPRKGTEPGKIRPVLVIQTNLLNSASHPSTIVCPMTTKIKKGLELMRVFLVKGTANVDYDCEIMIDQIRAIDNARLLSKIGELPDDLKGKVRKNVISILDLEI